LQDTQLFTQEGPGKSFYEVLLSTSYRRLLRGEHLGARLPGSGTLWLVSTCLNRFAQARTAVLLNCFVAALYFPRVRLVVTTFAADEDGLRGLARCCLPFVRCGLLTVASGGDAGASWRNVWEMEGLPTIDLLDTPIATTLMRAYPKTAAQAPQRGEAPAASSAAAVSVPSTPWPTPPTASEQLLCWHASVAKNTAHEVARAVTVASRGDVSREEVAVNVDCDNIVTPDYLEAVARIFGRDDGHYTMVLAKSNQGALTGRIAVRLLDFLTCGGYDEECFGTGYQDVDIRNRFEALRKTKEPNGVLEKLSGIPVVGGALPNDATDWRVDRGHAKICNMDMTATGGRKWGQMNTINMAAMKERTLRGEHVRNVHKIAKGRLGAQAFIFTAASLQNWLEAEERKAAVALPTSRAKAAASSGAKAAPPMPAARPSSRRSAESALYRDAGSAASAPPAVKARTLATAERGEAPLRLVSASEVRRMTQRGAADSFVSGSAASENLAGADVESLRSSIASASLSAQPPGVATQMPISLLCTGLRRFREFNDTPCASAT
jgi:hypothetical protein